MSCVAFKGVKAHDMNHVETFKSHRGLCLFFLTVAK